MDSAPPPSRLLRSAVTKSSLITNRVKPAKASAKRKTPIASPAAVVVAAVHRVPKANPPTRAKALRIRRNLLLRKRTRVSRVVRAVAQAREASLSSRASRVSRTSAAKSARKAIPTRVQSVPAVNLRVCAMHLESNKGSIRPTVRMPASRAK